MTREPADRARELAGDAEKFDGFGFVATAGDDVEVVLDAPNGEASLRVQLRCVAIYLDALADQLGDHTGPGDVANDALRMLDEREFAGVSRDLGGDDRR